MNSFRISDDDVFLMLQALDALLDCNPPEYLENKITALQLRIANHLPGFTEGELRNVCLGLETHLSEYPLDWKSSELLTRLRALLDPPSPKKRH